MIGSCLAAAAGAFTVFLGCDWIADRVASGPLARQVALKILIAACSVVAMWLWPRDANVDWALRGPGPVRWREIFLKALALGATATVLVLAGGGRGLQSALGTAGILQVLLVIWLLSSLSEELLTRGWLQGILHPWRDRYVASVAVPALVSGTVFGAMHLGLYFKGVDAVTATVVVVCATVLGVWAGVLRHRYSSLIPAIVAHVAFNAGGAVGGIAYAIAYRMATGHLPPQLVK
jgi:membrane protease YdiL (CAAX protease family)